MRQLTVEQRAKRATTRINRVVAEKYPLFVEEFSTTVEEQEYARIYSGRNRFLFKISPRWMPHLPSS